MVFAIAVRDPLPLPTGMTLTRERSSEFPATDDVVVLSLEPMIQMSLSGPGGARDLVHLRVHQVPMRVQSPDMQLVDCAMSVLRSGAGLADVPDLDDQETVATIVEATAVVRSPEDLVDLGEWSGALPRCLDTLFDVVRAYRVDAQEHISELTAERVFPVVPYGWRRLDSPDLVGDIGLSLLDHANVHTPPPEPLDDLALERFLQLEERLLAGDPLMLYRERRLESLISLSRDGQYAESAIQTAIAAEVLLDGVLGLLLWEEEERSRSSADDAVAVMSLDLSRKVRRHFHERLGGSWNLRGEGEVADWYRTTAALRNRVVHRGHRPTRAMAIESRECLGRLETFVCDRISDRATQYPRTALLIVGADGLRRRGAWDRDRFAAEEIGPVMDLVRLHGAWRTHVDGLVDQHRSR